MSLPIAAMDPVLATFLLATFVLIAGVVLILKALTVDDEKAKQVFTAVGVLFGLLAAGGLGTLFAKQAADEAASSAATTAASEVAPEAASAAANQVSEEVTQQVEKALEAPPNESSGGTEGNTP
jgi:hypothetical protein